MSDDLDELKNWLRGTGVPAPSRPFSSTEMATARAEVDAERTSIPRIRFHDVLGLAVQRSDGTWQLIPHGVTRSWTVTDVWIMSNPGWRELTVVEEEQG